MPVNVVAVGIGEAARVAVRRTVEQQHERPFRDDAAVVLGVLRHVTRLHRRRRFEAQRLLDRPGDQRRVGGEFASLIRVIGEQLSHETDQPRGGLVAGAGDHGGVGQHLGARQRAPGAVGFVDLGSEQLGHQIVGGMIGPPLDVFGEQRDRVGEHVRVHRGGITVAGQLDVGDAAVPDLLLVFLGMPSR